MKSKFRESLREGIVVVSSILIAFGLDAWWGYRQDRSDEAELVAGLIIEFEGNRERISEDIEYVRSYTTAAENLLSIAVGESPHLADSAGYYLWLSMSWRTTNLSAAVLDAILAGGQLDLIRNDSLRFALAGWSSVAEDAAEEEVFEWREIIERYRPLVGRYVQIPVLEGMNPPGLPNAASLKALFNSIEFRSALAMRVDVSLVASYEKQVVLEEIEIVIGLLRSYTF